MITSAHGNLQSLVENLEISGMIEGTQNVILGNVNAVQSTSGALCKVVKEWAGTPTFNVLANC
jgi:hypothetical protein